jgi:hypothetical protein
MAEKKALNLLDALVAATGRHQDHRFRPWARLVTGVDKTKTDGYAFIGGFVKEGTVEVELKPKVFIVMTSEGSAKYQTKYYTVVVMDAQGNLTKTDIATDESKGQGWALRLRDDVASLVDSLSDVPAVPVLQGNKALAWKIYQMLKDKGVDIGNASAIFIEQVLDEAGVQVS